METSNKKHVVYLGLGSNLGEREANLLAALAALPPRIEVLERSPVYETAPWGYLDQGDFLNQVIKVATSLSPLDLLAALKEIEKQVGRVPRFKNGPREIDIDVLFFDDQVIEEKGLHIPHPQLARRAFVLMPLNDIAPELVHPVLGKTIAQLLADLDAEPQQPLEQGTS